ncbi:MAG: exopolysaccharide biosynthesis polyprenyl glycosylphosphotransferase [Rhodospirillales bacterium]|nr:exopolysaccharide biosynthesis polyprenyl glycosylphosphotransferase [Rhodospirillales bacterium]
MTVHDPFGSRPQPPRARARVAARRRPADGWLARQWRRHPAPELAGLWLIEVLACAALVYLLLSGGGGGGLGAADKAVVLALTFGVTSLAVGLYSPDTYLETRLLLVNTAVGAALAFPLLWAVGRLVGSDLVGLTAHGGMRALLAWTLLLFGLRLGFSWALRADMFVRRVLIVGPDAAANRLADTIRTVRRGFFEVSAVLPVEEAAALVGGRVPERRLWGVILADAAADTLPARVLLRAQARGLRLYTDSEFWERQLRRIDVDRNAAADAVIGGEEPSGQERAPEGLAAAPRRLFDIALSLTMLVFTLPLMLLTALAIKLDSPGPALYRQERVGLGGRRFTLLKFRSKHTDAEACGPVWAAQRDPRVTRVGSLIRLIRVDELPQLLNILRGEMSFIGPRPERPHFVAQLERVMPCYVERSRVKPGLTGWAQVNYPYGASVEDARAKLSYDLYYVKHRGLLLDLLILLATVRVVLFQRGAR